MEEDVKNAPVQLLFYPKPDLKAQAALLMQTETVLQHWLPEVRLEEGLLSAKQLELRAGSNCKKYNFWQQHKSPSSWI